MTPAPNRGKSRVFRNSRCRGRAPALCAEHAPPPGAQRKIEIAQPCERHYRSIRSRMPVLSATIFDAVFVRAGFGTCRLGLITVWLPVRVLLYRGGLVSSAFRLLRRSGVGCHSQDPRFSSGSALWPSHDGIRRMRRTNLPRRPCRKTYGRHKDSKRTRLIHRPCGDIAPPVGGIHVFSCRVLLCTTRCEIRHDARHKCALTARSLLFAQSR